MQALSEESIQGFDIAIFSAGATTSRAWAPRFAAAGCVVVDNSSAFRRDPEIPLVVSEVNPEALDAHKGIIANPNCSTMQLMVALKPIHDAAGIERLIVSTYQSVSGTGVARPSRSSRTRPTRCCTGMEMPAPEVYPHPIAFNVLGGAGNFPDGDDHTDEERKMMFETRKILGDESIAISVTCARVPGHLLALGVGQRSRRASRSRSRRRARCSRRCPGSRWSSPYPTAAERRRQATTCSSAACAATRRTSAGCRCGWSSDNLHKGAATNAVQLAELLHARGLVGTRAAA